MREVEKDRLKYQEVLEKITVNIGTIEGVRSPMLSQIIVRYRSIVAYHSVLHKKK